MQKHVRPHLWVLILEFSPKGACTQPQPPEASSRFLLEHFSF